MKDGHNSKVTKKLNIKILTKGDFESMISGKDVKEIDVLILCFKTLYFTSSSTSVKFSTFS